MLIKFGKGLDNQLTLQLNPNTRLHQFKAFNSVLSVENVQALQAWVEGHDNRNLGLRVRNFGSSYIVSWDIEGSSQFLARKDG